MSPVVNNVPLVHALQRWSGIYFAKFTALQLAFGIVHGPADNSSATHNPRLNTAYSKDRVRV